MSMSKQDFIALADIIRDNREAFSDEAVSRLAQFCGWRNSNFNRGRWFDYIAGKCGPNGGRVK